MSFFKDYFQTTDDRVLMKWAHYYDVYERELARYRDRPISFLEIGVFKGGSVDAPEIYGQNIAAIRAAAG